MSNRGKGFTQKDKYRITRTETKKFWNIPRDVLGAKVQKLVDTGLAVSTPASQRRRP